MFGLINDTMSSACGHRPVQWTSNSSETVLAILAIGLVKWLDISHSYNSDRNYWLISSHQSNRSIGQMIQFTLVHECTKFGRFTICARNVEGNALQSLLICMMIKMKSISMCLLHQSCPFLCVKRRITTTTSDKSSCEKCSWWTLVLLIVTTLKIAIWHREVLLWLLQLHRQLVSVTQSIFQWYVQFNT